VLDLLDQVAAAAGADTTLRATAREAITAMRRGVIAYTGVG
jgi:ATP-dependent RNA helicase HelY